jgi:hypothetical protein
MKKILFLLILSASLGMNPLAAQDMVGLTHKQVLEYWQSKAPADQINDTGDLIVIGERTFMSFTKKTCVDFTTIIAASEIDKYKSALNADKQLHYEPKKDSWVNEVKKFTWTITKSDSVTYQVNCKKL